MAKPRTWTTVILVTHDQAEFELVTHLNLILNCKKITQRETRTFMCKVIEADIVEKACLSCDVHAVKK